MTSFTHARSQRFELELRHVPPESRGDRAPPPARPARSVRLLRRARADRRGLRRSPTTRSTSAAVAVQPPSRRRAAAPRASAVRRRRRPASTSAVEIGASARAVGWRAWRSRACRRARCRGRATAAAAIVSATPVPASTRDARAVGLRLVVGRRVHREHDAQVDERARSTAASMPMSASAYWPASTAALNTDELGDEPPVSGTPACASRNNVSSPASTGWRAREPAVVVERVVGRRRCRATHRDDRERADRHERVGEQVEERGARALARSRPARRSARSRRGDRRVREHALHVGLHDRGDAADEQREHGERPDRSGASRRGTAANAPTKHAQQRGERGGLRGRRP